MSNSLQVLFLLLLMFSCSVKENPSDIDTIKISPETHQNDSLLSTIDNIEIVKLETQDSSLLDYIRKIEFYNSKIYIVVSGLQSPVYVFNDNGDYLNQIGKSGRGPKEYLELRDIIVDDEIEIFSYPDKIIRYAHSGDYLDSEKPKFPFGNIAKLNNGIYAVYFGSGTVKDDSYNLYLTDENLNVLSKHISRGEEYNKYGELTSIFSKHGGGISFLPEYSDTVYVINNDGIFNPHYHLDFGKYQVTEEFLKKIINYSPIDYFKTKQNTYASFLKYFETQKYSWINYQVTFAEPETHFAIFSKNNKKTFNFHCRSDDPVTSLFSNLIGTYNDKFVFSVEVHYLKKLLAIFNNDFSEEKVFQTNYFDKLFQIAQQSEIDDNPVLLFVTLNDQL